MVTFVTLVAVLSAEPTAVLVQARSGISVDEFKKATTVIDAELSRVGDAWSLEDTQKRLKAAGLGDASTCGGKQACLLELSKKLQARFVVLLSVSKVGRDRAWALAGFDVASGSLLAREDWLDETNGDVSVPVVRFADRLAPLVKPVQKDAPVVAKLDPQPPPPPPLVVVEPAASKPLPKILLIGAGVAAAAAVGLAIGSAVTAGQLNQVTTGPDGLKLSSMTAAQAQTTASTANALTGAAIASGVVAAGLGTGAILTW
ncbi:MAG: hypothetical protein GQE15_13225 [Archangiaceae bacterium]|nr:hypothetical protein [Archangiaceae bacterium]